MEKKKKVHTGVQGDFCTNFKGTKLESKTTGLCWSLTFDPGPTGETVLTCWVFQKGSVILTFDLQKENESLNHKMKATFQISLQMRLSEPLSELSLWRILKIQSHNYWDSLKYKGGGFVTTSNVDVCVNVWGKTTESLFCSMALTTMTEWQTTLTVAGREEQNSWHWFSTYIDNVACWGIYWRDKEPHKSPYYHHGDIYFTYKHTLQPTHSWSYHKDNLLCSSNLQPSVSPASRWLMTVLISERRDPGRGKRKPKWNKECALLRLLLACPRLRRWRMERRTEVGTLRRWMDGWLVKRAGEVLL